MNSTTPEIPVSIGELMDKWTILTIKAHAIKDEEKLNNIMAELEILSDIVSPYQNHSDVKIRFNLNGLLLALYEVNQDLWEIEDDIRDLEREQIPQKIINYFHEGGALDDDEVTRVERFVELAQSVYITNDKRCAIKRKINELLLSGFVEEKSYTEY